MKIKSKISTFLDNISINNSKEIKEVIESHDIISFDIFDTLVKRDCDIPTDVFRYMERDDRCKLKDFANVRIEAEKNARERSDKQEITLDDIYASFPSSLSEKEREHLKQLEISYEEALCKLNPEIIPILDFAQHTHKTIVIITDMYLPDSVLHEILNRCSVSYSKLYSSGHYGVTKHDGGLYRLVVDDMRVNPKRIVHIGDSFKSDYLMARKSGMDSIHIAKKSLTGMFVDKKYFKKNSDYRALCQFISNHRECDNHDVFYSTGFECLGPVLYGFEKWLIKELKSEGFTDVYFLARDGQIMKKAFDLFETGIKSHYFYGSRRALIVPTLWMHPELSDIKGRIAFYDRDTIASLMHMIGLDADNYNELISIAGFDIHALYKFDDLFKNQKFIKLYNEKIKKYVIRNSKNEYAFLNRYLNQEKINGKTAIVDIGWYGNMQKALCEIVGDTADIHGYYVGVYPNSRNVIEHRIKASGYLFDIDSGYDRYQMEYVFTPIFEDLFTADHGTTIKYKESNKRIIPVLDKWEFENSDAFDKLKVAQNAALSFIKMAAAESEMRICWTPSLAFANMANLGCAPEKATAEAWGDMVHQDSVATRYIARPKKLINYILHPQSLFGDISTSYWKIGFLTRLLGDKIPHYKIYSFLKKHFKKNKTKKTGNVPNKSIEKSTIKC